MTATIAEPDRLGYLPALDGLRGAAVIAVIAFHAELDAPGGFLGVSTFFTLSGFLITSLLLLEHHHHGRIRLGRFWSRRARRLLPAAFVAIALVALVSWRSPIAEPSPGLAGDLLASLAYVANWRFVASDLSYADLFADPSPVLHLWSLAVEEQFYLLFPVLAVAALAGRGDQRLRLGAVLVAGIAASVALTVFASFGTDRIYYGTDTRGAELLLGGLAAVVVSRRPELPGRRLVQGLGVAALAVSMVAWLAVDQEADWLYRGGLPLYGVVTTLLVVAAAHTTGVVGELLSLPPLRHIGVLSYGLYLYHWPVFLWLDEVSTDLTGWRLLTLRLLVTYALTWVSYNLLEQPVRRGVTPFGEFLSRKRPAIAAMALLVGAGVGSFGLAVAGELSPSAGYSYRFDPATAAAGPALAAQATDPDVDVAAADVAADDAAAEVAGGTVLVPLVAVLGDSFAHGAAQGLEAWAEHTGRAEVWNLARRSCGLTPYGPRYLWAAGEEGDACYDSVDEVIGLAANVRATHVVVFTSFIDLFPTTWPDGTVLGGIAGPSVDFDQRLSRLYTSIIHGLRDLGVWVTVVDMPCVGRENLLAPGLPDAAIEHFDTKTMSLLRAEFADDPAVRFAGLFDRLCPGGAFEADPGGVPDARPDGVHLTDDGARWLAAWLGPEVLTDVAPTSSVTQEPAGSDNDSSSSNRSSSGRSAARAQ